MQTAFPFPCTTVEISKKWDVETAYPQMSKQKIMVLSNGTQSLKEMISTEKERIFNLLGTIKSNYCMRAVLKKAPFLADANRCNV